MQLFSAQVEESVAQPGFLWVLLIAENHQRQLVRRAKHFDLADEHLDLAGRQLRVDQLGIAGLHLSIDADAPFCAHLLDLGKSGAVGVAQHLRDPIMVAQVDEQNAAVIADPMDPARQADRLADMGFVQLDAGLAAIGVHGGPLGSEN